MPSTMTHKSHPKTRESLRMLTLPRPVALSAATHAVLRIGVGLLFFLHGTPKLFGWFGGFGEPGATAPLFSLMGLAGVLEVFGGSLIVLGLLTRPVAVILALEMVIAYFMAHFPQGWVPLQNGGELALLYGLAFVFLAVNGAGPWSLDRIVRLNWRRS